HTRFSRDWSSDVCSSDLREQVAHGAVARGEARGGGERLETVRAGELLAHGSGEVGHGVEAGHALAVEPVGELLPAEGGLARGQRSEERRVGEEWRSRRGP